MNPMALMGLLLGIGGILFGNLLEGGHFESLLQGAAFIIVMCGTWGAVILSTKKEDFARGWKMISWVLKPEDQSSRQKAYAEIMDCARLARKESLLALEARSAHIQNKFLRNVIRAVADGIDPQVVRETFETQIVLEEKSLISGSKIWLDAGGFAPTVGIIGAVLGLIHVMGNLTDTSKLGSGIAVAFVATIYGVGFANLIFLPVGNRLKKKIHDEMAIKEMILEGGIAILKGLSPTMVELKLQGYLKAPE